MVERAAAPLLGAPAYGVFCTAYVRDDSGAPAEVWLGRRSKSKPTWPGCWTASRPAAWPPANSRATRWPPSAMEEAGVAEDLLRTV